MPDPDRPQGPPLSSWRRVIRSFRFAGAGVVFVVRTQPNARVHLLVASLVITAAALLRVGPLAWAILLLDIALVISLEAMNTAIEFAVDLASPGYHDLAKAAKDVAAAAVLVAATLSVVVGLLVLGPPLWARIGWG
jgi:undecaprenol kinase